MSSTSRFLLVTLLIVAVCSANLATGRASLRPSAGKRSAILVGRTPAHYYHLAAKRFDNELSCNAHTMSVLSAQYEQLQEQLEQLAELIDACEAVRAI